MPSDAERRLLEVRIRLEALITEREAMVAQNLQRQSCGQAMAYDDMAFMGVAAQMSELLCAIDPAAKPETGRET